MTPQGSPTRWTALPSWRLVTLARHPVALDLPDVAEVEPLVNAGGWVEVHKHTLQHTRLANVFGLGDASSLPTSKTGAAVRKQAPVLASNLLSLMKQEPLTASYGGYTSCPVVTGYDSLVLAEFD